MLDAAIYYEHDRFKVQININNLLDREYYVGSYDQFYVLPGDPLMVRASVEWRF